MVHLCLAACVWHIGCSVSWIRGMVCVIMVWTRRLGMILLVWPPGTARASGIAFGGRGLCGLDWIAWDDLAVSSCLWLGQWRGVVCCLGIGNSLFYIICRLGTCDDSILACIWHTGLLRRGLCSCPSTSSAYTEYKMNHNICYCRLILKVNSMK